MWIRAKNCGLCSDAILSSLLVFERIGVICVRYEVDVMVISLAVGGTPESFLFCADKPQKQVMQETGFVQAD